MGDSQEQLEGAVNEQRADPGTLLQEEVLNLEQRERHLERQREIERERERGREGERDHRWTDHDQRGEAGLTLVRKKKMAEPRVMISPSRRR